MLARQNRPDRATNLTGTAYPFLFERCIMHSITPAGQSTSPFDSIKQIREDGTEFWSARDLAPMMGYTSWQRFDANVIRRAKAAAENQKVDLNSAFSRSDKRVQAGTGSTNKKDYELSRFAAYLVAMNGEPNKPEVAAAQAYFAIQTHVAETQPQVTAPATRLKLLQMAMDAEKERLALEERTKELEPKAEAYDRFMDADGAYSVGNIAKMLGLSQNKLFDLLRNEGILISKGHMRNTPYQPYMRHFTVKAFEFERTDGTRGTSYTPRVQPSGINFICKKLGLDKVEVAA